MKTIFDQIYKEKKEYENTEITIVDGYTFNQKETIERAYRYYNSRFLTGDIDAEGNKKYFFNIVKNPCKVTTKAIDFDTKNINIETASGGSVIKTWYLERDLKFWFKDINFGRVLNRIFDELPKFGSVVLKMVDNKPEFVDLRNFIVEQTADTLDKANYIIERHLYSPIEFRMLGERMGWDNIEKVVEETHKLELPYITVYERYGEVEKTSEEGKKSYEYKRAIVADLESNQFTSNPKNGYTLEEVKVERHPYREFHLEKIAGRWLGVGIVEILFDTQVRQNEIVNLQAKGSYWAALRIFQTRDDTVNRNLKSDVKDGEVLDVESEITQIDMSDRNLAFFNEETNKWLKERDELTFSYDVIRGERLPAGTPLGSAQLAASMTSSHFDQIRENIALDIKELLYNVIIPQFLQENNREHILRIAGEDLDKVKSLIIAQKATDALFSFMKKKGKLPNKIQYEATKEAIGLKVKKGQEKLLKIPKDFYKNVKYKIDIIITGESKDTRIWSQTLFAALQAITTDPTIISDPMKRKLFYKWLEAGGVSPIDLETEEASPMQALMPPMPKGAGGGVSKPMMPDMGQEQRI